MAVIVILLCTKAETHVNFLNVDPCTKLLILPTFSSSQTELTDDNVQEVAMEVQMLTKNTSAVKTDGILSTSKILEDVVLLNSTDIEVRFLNKTTFVSF